jgi:hypothetical protein
VGKLALGQVFLKKKTTEISLPVIFPPMFLIPVTTGSVEETVPKTNLGRYSGSIWDSSTRDPLSPHFLFIFIYPLLKMVENSSKYSTK